MSPGCCTALRGALKAGTTDYLEVLTDETNSFSAELGWHRPRRTNSLLWSSSTKLWAAFGNN